MPALRELDLSEVNISKLPARSFYRSLNVERVVLPKSLTEIGERVFAESQLKEVHLYDNRRVGLCRMYKISEYHYSGKYNNDRSIGLCRLQSAIFGRLRAQ